MVQVGIEAMNLYPGVAYIDVMELAEHRGLELKRFENLLMREKTVPMPYEDPVSFAVNAAAPLVASLSEEERSRIEMLVTCSESGIDFGKSMSSYIHDLLGLDRNCRLFELKQACYSGTAGFQNGVNFVLAQTSPGARALVIGTDISRFMVAETRRDLPEDWSFAEPSNGAGAVALLVSERPDVFSVDVGANGYYGYEVMDTCRPVPDRECGDADLSLLSYLDCCEQAFAEYSRRVAGVDYRRDFHYLAFHTPFGGMVKGAHRAMMRKIARASAAEIEADFEQRVSPGFSYCQRVGNIMGGTVFMSLAGIIDHGRFDSPKRVGCFSYGSGCCSEFYSGVVTAASQERQRRFRIPEVLDARYKLSMDEYDALLAGSGAVKFGTRDLTSDFGLLPGVKKAAEGRRLLFLEGIGNYHREYSWQ